MRLKLVFLFLQVLLLVGWTNGSDILAIFSSPSKSHNVLGVKLVEGLLKRGHHVTFVNPFPTPKMANLTSIEMSSISEFFKDVMKKNDDLKKDGFVGNFNRLYTMLTAPNELFWNDAFVQKLIKEKPKFDLLISISFFNDAILGLGHHLGVPTIVFHSIGSHVLWNHYTANPSMSYSVNPMAGIPTDSFWGRLGTTSVNLIMGAVNRYVVFPFNQGMLDKHLPNSPPLEEIQRDVSVVLANSHYSIEPARPYVPNMIQIGGYHVQEVKPLTGEFKKFMDEAKQGVVLFSLGGNVQVSLLDEEKRKAIFKVLGEIAPIRVVFKSELKHENVPKNIMVSSWVPQIDILAHRNTKLFVSHCGWGGVTESVYHGVPILAMPFMGDQIGNAMQAQSAGYADLIKPADVTEEAFREKLKGMLSNPKFTNNVKSRSALMKEQPVKPMENVIFWVEHVIKYGGGKHLQNTGAYLTWYQLYMVDIYVFFTAVLVLLLLFNILAIKLSIRIYKRLFGKKNVEKKGKGKEKKS